MDINSLSKDESFAINNISPAMQSLRVGERLRSAINQGIGFREEQRYYVRADGSDSADGLSWDSAFRTIQHACNVARYLPGTTTIDSSKNREKYIFIAPGVYNEQVLFSGYNIHVIGLSFKVGNVDYGVVINKDGAVASTCVFGFTGAGIEVAGIQVNVETAIPGIYAPSAGDGCWVHDCFVAGDNTNATHGIKIDDCRNTIVENNRIFNCVTAGITVGKDGTTWFRNSRVSGNHVAGTTGIGIQVPVSTICGAGDGSIIDHNYIVGTCTTGIHQAEAGAYVLVANNWIQAGTALTDAGTGSANNHTAS